MKDKKNAMAAQPILSTKAVVPSPFVSIEPSPLSGRMTLHKGRGRKEELFFFHCNDWEQLPILLRNPIKYFKEVVKAKDDAPMSPVVAIIRPIDPDQNEPQLAASHILASTVTSPFSFLKEKDLNDETLTIDEKRLKSFEGFRESLKNDENGWFLAEFANKTHVLNIYYQAPKKPSASPRYRGRFTTPMVCTLDDRKDQTFGQTHFDLEVDNSQPLSHHRADFIVDYIEDGGRRMCANLNRFHKKKETTELGRILSPTAAAPKILKAKFDGVEFSTTTIRDEGKDDKGVRGVSLVVEGLSFTPTSDDGDPLETFVCLQNSSMIEGQIYLHEGTLKIYTAPAGGG